MFNDNDCCMPPIPRKNDCCCKDGIICALDYFFQDFLSTTSSIKLGTLKYYPKFKGLENIIYNIPYIACEIVPACIEPPEDPYNGDITYLNICELEGFEFQFTNAVTKLTKECEIATRFSHIRYVSPKNCCCKNGLMEYLLKARDFLSDPGTCNGGTMNPYVILSTSTKNFIVSSILAINSDTVWAKYDMTNAASQQTIYYVISLCKLKGITFKK